MKKYLAILIPSLVVIIFLIIVLVPLMSYIGSFDSVEEVMPLDKAITLTVITSVAIFGFGFLFVFTLIKMIRSLKSPKEQAKEEDTKKEAAA